MVRMALLLAMVGVLAGCQLPATLKPLQDENEALKGQLSEARQEIDQLTTQTRLLKNEVTELNRVTGVLSTERNARVEESSSLRGQVRRYMQQQIDALKEFLLQENLLDYVGGELVERSGSGGATARLLVDLAHPVPAAGSVTGVGGYFSKPTPFRVKVLRPVDKRLMVIWESPEIHPQATGVQRLTLPVAVGVEQGDLLAFFFPGEVGVTFDTGTGDVRHLNADLALGGATSPGTLLGSGEKRAYSIGVYALLN